MKQENPASSDVIETTVIGSIKLQERPYRVNVPVFEDIKVERPIFVDKQVEVPSGLEKLIVELTDQIAEKIMSKVELVIGARLDKAIDQRISQIKSPKIVEELHINYKEIDVEHPVFRDVEVSRPVYVDKEVINPIIKDVSVTNAKIEDVTVINAVITDQKVTNAIIKDVEVERAVIREKTVDIIHKMCHDQAGNPL